MITTMGEALIDIIIDSHGDVTSVVGGAALNTARAIARLGVPVEYLGGLSSDPLGDRIRRSIAQDNIRIAIPEATEAPTTLAVAQISSVGSASYRFLLGETSVASVEPHAAVSSISAECTFLHVGGIALAVEPSAGAAVAVVRESPPDRLVMLDPNFRPAIAGKSPVFRRALEVILARVDVLKVSTEDLALLFPNQEPLAAANELRERFDFAVLLTAGAEDVWILSAGKDVRCPVPAVEVVDTVGAGDSFSGGFAAWWTLNGLETNDLRDVSALTEGVQAGMTVAAMSCARQGAEPPWREELPANWSRRPSTSDPVP